MARQKGDPLANETVDQAFKKSRQLASQAVQLAGIPDMLAEVSLLDCSRVISYLAGAIAQMEFCSVRAFGKKMPMEARANVLLSTILFHMKEMKPILEAAESKGEGVPKNLAEELRRIGVLVDG